MTDFIKMHGLGNDFVIFDARVAIFEGRAELSRRVAHRRFSVGADQVIFMEKSSRADIAVDMYNYDGSIVRACGNASRCVAQLVMDETGKPEVSIETVSGIITCVRQPDGQITINMGAPRLDWRDIPLAQEADTLFVPLGGGEASCVNMGNPHAVFFVKDVVAIPLEQVGRALEHDAIFPDRANIEFVQVIDRNHLRMRVWERGVGITMACGTGACAAAVAAVRRGLAGRHVEIALDGGTLQIEWRDSDSCVYMTGPVEISYRGTLPV